MKKIINILGVSALLLAFTSCEDWLDMPSESKADSSSIFSTIGRAEMTVVAPYAKLHTQMKHHLQKVTPSTMFPIMITPMYLPF